MEEDDPVVQEIPVYLSQALTEHLYIYQYPIKPANRDWNSCKVVNAQIKPNNQIVKLEVGIDTYSDKYSYSKGEQIALNTDGHQEPTRRVKDKEREKAPYFKHGLMDKIVYESSQPCADTRHYAVAMLQDKELHLTSVKGIVQLRPSFSYFDRQNKKKKDSDKMDSDEEDEEPQAQQVTVKFARQESAVAKKAREQSFDFLTKKCSEEPWYDALYRHNDTDHADLERLKLLCAWAGTGASEGAALGVRGAQYVRALVPHAPRDPGLQLPAPPTLAERCRELLIHAKLLTFTELQSLTGADSTALAAALRTGGRCVLPGLWAARSADLFSSWPAAAAMRAARDRVLVSFAPPAAPAPLHLATFAAAARLPPAAARAVLATLATPTRDGWRLSLPPEEPTKRDSHT